MAQVTLTKDFQVPIPEEICRTVSLEAGQRIDVDIQDGVITLMPSPISESPENHDVKSLFAVWQDEDATDDPQEIESRHEDLESFKEAINTNRCSERPIYP